MAKTQNNSSIKDEKNEQQNADANGGNENSLTLPVVDEQQNEQEQQKTEPVTLEKKPIVVLMISAEDSKEVVDISIAAWQKNFAGHELLLVGGKYGDFKTIDFVPNEDENINLANILAAVMADENVSEKFILSRASTFPVNKIGLHNIEILKCNSVKLADKRLMCLKEFSELAVTEQLKKEGIENVVNYETGLPVLFEKEKLVELFEKFNPQKTPTKVISLYLNFYNQGYASKPVDYIAGIFATRVARKEANLQIVKQGLEVSDFFLINTDGYIAAGKLIEEHLK